ncbi:MAG: hypothetical protein ACOCP8_06705 [archaeon]
MVKYYNFYQMYNSLIETLKEKYGEKETKKLIRESESNINGGDKRCPVYYNKVSLEEYKKDYLEKNKKDIDKLSKIIKNNGENKIAKLDGMDIQKLTGTISEELVKKYFKDNQEYFIRQYVQNYDDVKNVRVIDDSINGKEIDLGFIISLKNGGKKVICVEVKYGNGGLSNSQKKFYSKIYHNPERVKSEFIDGRVILVKVEKFNLEEGWFNFYYGEMKIPKKGEFKL